MSYTVLARKYRPQIFADLVGQEHVSRTLGNAIEGGRVAHAFLFTGARGVGKTTTARLLAKALNCEKGPTPTPCGVCDACREIAAGVDLDVLEIDGASNNGVDDVRRLQETLPFRPARDRFKIVIVDEVHMLSSGAFNAFLKTLEEPPSHVKFIFATTEVHKVPITIRSRCQRYDFRLIPHAVVASKVREILAAEHVEADDAAIALVAREAAGSMRDALTVLDQLLALGGSVLRGESVASGLGIASRDHVFGCLESLLSGDAAACLRSVSTMLEQGLDTLHFAKQLLECARDLVVLRVVGDADDLVDLAPGEHERALRLARAHERPELERLFAGLAKLVEEVGEAGLPQMSLEMGLVRLADRPPLVALSEIVERLRAFEQRMAGGGGGQAPAAGGGGGGGTARTPLKRGPGPEAAAPRSARVTGVRGDELGSSGPGPVASAALTAAGPLAVATGVALASAAAVSVATLSRPALAAVAAPIMAAERAGSTQADAGGLAANDRGAAPITAAEKLDSTRAEAGALAFSASVGARLATADSAGLMHGDATGLGAPAPLSAADGTHAGARESPAAALSSVAPAAAESAEIESGADLTTAPRLTQTPVSTLTAAASLTATAGADAMAPAHGSSTLGTNGLRQSAREETTLGPARAETPTADRMPTPPRGDASRAAGETRAARRDPAEAEPVSRALASVPFKTGDEAAWPRIVQHIKASQPALGAVLDHGVPIEVSAEVLRIGFPDGSFFGRQAQNANAKEAILRAAQQVLGTRPTLTIGGVGDAKVATLAQTEENARRTHTAARREIALSHPSVVDAMEVFEESEGSVDVQVDSE